jgi:hypothetical protein
VDNGPEFVSKALDAWAYRHGVQLIFSRPGKPTENPFVEVFHSHFRDECLDQHWFASLEEARQIIEAWRTELQRAAATRGAWAADAGRVRGPLGAGAGQLDGRRRLTLQVDQKTGADQPHDGLS